MSLDESQRLAPGLRYPHGDAVPGSGEAIEVADRILWLRLPLPMKLDHVNVYALDDGDGWTIIDTGYASEKMHEAWAAALTGPLAGKPVKRVIATHHHPDHIGLAGWFQTEHQAELWTTRTAWLTARMMELEPLEVHHAAYLAHAERHGAPPHILDAIRARGAKRFFTTAPLPPGFRRIKEGDRIEAGGRHWRVFIGAGHAPEHATLWSADGALVIAGDQILPKISPNLSVWANEPESDPVGDWIEACTRFQPYAQDEHLVLPGHNRPFTGLPRRLDQLIENHHGALKRLRRALSKPLSATECFQAIYMRSIADGEHGLALGEAIAHLNHLWLTGEATRRADKNGVWRFEMAKTA